MRKIVDLSISTDGIHTFKKYDNLAYPAIATDEIFNRFYMATDDLGNEHMLKKALYRIEKENGLKPSDDLTIIRLVDGE